MNADTIGALNDTEVLLVDAIQGKRALRSIPLPPNVSELEGLLEVLWQIGLTSAWVMPGTTLSHIATCVWFEQANLHWVVITHPALNEPTRPISVSLWPKGSSQWEARRLTFIFPEYAGWDWVLSNVKSLLATVTYLEQVLARPVIDSPDIITHQLLADLALDQSPSRISTSPENLDTTRSGVEASIAMMESARDIKWMRPLTLAEHRQRYLHKYIHISPYLEACIVVRLGEGMPEYSSKGRGYDGLRPGIWRTHIERVGSIFDDKHLPSCVDGQWMSTPQVKCCQDIGYHIYVQEGYYWPQSHELLKRWAMTLWHAAQGIHTHPQSYGHAQAKANVIRTIKQLVQLGVTIIAKNQNAGGRGRRDWWIQIIGQSKAILFTHLASLARKGTMPVLVAQDAIWVVSDDPNPVSAVPGLVPAHGWRGYTIGYDAPLPLSSEVKSTFRAGDHPDQVARTLDALAGEVSSVRAL